MINVMITMTPIVSVIQADYKAPAPPASLSTRPRLSSSPSSSNPLLIVKLFIMHISLQNTSDHHQFKSFPPQCKLRSFWHKLAHLRAGVWVEEQQILQITASFKIFLSVSPYRFIGIVHRYKYEKDFNTHPELACFLLFYIILYVLYTDTGTPTLSLRQ